MKKPKSSISLAKIQPAALRIIKRAMGITDYQIQAILQGIAHRTQIHLGSKNTHASDMLKIERIGLDHYRQKQYFDATFFYLYVIAIDNTKSTAWRGLAACFQASGMYHFARAFYSRALYFDKDDLILHVALGECCFLNGFADIGLSILTKVSEETPIKPEHIDCIKRAKMLVEIHTTSNKQDVSLSMPELNRNIQNLPDIVDESLEYLQ